MSIPLTIIDGTFTRDENMLEYTVKEDGGDEWGYPRPCLGV